MASKQEIKSFRVDQNKRQVVVYVNSLDETEEKRVNFYRDSGYKIVALDKNKPKTRAKTSITKDDLKKYLKGEIDDKIYNKMIERLKTNENFLVIKSWLKEELQKDAKRKAKKYVPFNTIVRVARENEQIEINKNAKDYEYKNKKKDTDKEEENEE